MAKIRYYLDWLFRDRTSRRGKYVIAEVPNLPLIIFMIAIILSVAIYPGTLQKVVTAVAYLSLIYWGILEYKSGRSRFRQLLGILGIIAAIGAALLTVHF